YRLIAQMGSVEKIEPGFTVKVSEYRMFKDLSKHRTIVAKETNSYLRSKGIQKYSATGVGDLVKVDGFELYQYVLSFNTLLNHDAAAPTLNIIGMTVTHMLRDRHIERKQAALTKDLDKAREIQRSILPAHEVKFHNYEIFGISMADRIVGGDFFDYIRDDEDDRLGIAVGDAASKGISAAVQALYVSGALKMGAGYQTKISSLIRKLNNLVHHAFSDDRFITLFYCELAKDKQGLCTYVNAGHCLPMLFRAATETIELLEATGNILGPFPDQYYRSEGVMIAKGDILLIYTDGVSEAMDPSGNQFSEERLGERLKELKKRTAKEITSLLIQDVLTFNTRGKYSDDKTIVVVKRVR
ncbi:MAG TPA: PP2C family protein-serine/threonine phosphatase, partial [Bacteroidota bacterium]|nr:PP2C family protein-serine/threonine phosphatase [Bacteroidota bacterium]